MSTKAMDLTPKQQTSEAIRQSESILILTGQNPSIDQVTAVLSLAMILRKFGKKVSALISDPTPQQLSFLDQSGLDKNLSGLRDFILKVDVTKSEVDKLRYEVEGSKLHVYITPSKGGFAPSDVTFDYGDFQYDLAIVLGVPSRSRIDRIYADHQGIFATIPLINIDFHRSSENYGAVNLIEPNASSLCEILVASSESLQTGLIDADIATVMLTGLMASTDRFTATHTTSKSLTVAAQLMAAGARQQAVVKALYRSNERDTRPTNTTRPEQPRRENPPFKPTLAPVARPVQETPRTEPVKSPSTEVPEPEVVIQAIGPVAQVEDYGHEPIIDPAHIELATDGDHYDPNMEVADFAAAAEILQQRLNRELPGESDR
jgi:hypothetical protein